MRQGIKILGAKLSTPKTGDTIERQRLSPLQAQILHKLITTVTAGAGYGKTTLIAQAVRDRDVVWYRLDRTDADLSTFFSYLAEGIRRHYPGFGEELNMFFTKSPLLTPGHESTLISILAELESVITQDLTIVLDDYHLVADNLEIRKSLGFMLELLPPKVHLVFISRTDVDLPLSRLRATREVLDITSEHLAFTPEETAEFFQKVFHITLRQETINVLHDKTKGWVSGLILFYHSAQGRQPEIIEMLLGDISGSPRIVSDYLEENIYAFLQPQKRDFLIKTSILSHLSPHICNRLLAIEHADAILRDLEKSHLFTYSYAEGEEEYYYHHLFQEFLRNKLPRELGMEGFRSLHAAAARIFDDLGETEEAISHSILAQDYEKACSLTSRVGVKLVKAGQFRRVKGFLDGIPPRCYEQNPWLIYIRSYIQAFSGQIREAFSGYTSAQDIFDTLGITEGSDLCEDGLASIYFFRGDFGKAEEKIRRLLQSETLDPQLRVEMLGNLVFIMAYLGRFDDADSYAERAFERLSSVPETTSREVLRAYIILNKGRRYAMSGDPILALGFAEQGMEILRRHKHSRLIALSYSISSECQCQMGNYQEGLRHAAAGIEYVNEPAIRDPLYGWLLINHAISLIGLTDLDKALSFGRKSLEFFQDIDSPWAQAHGYLILGEVSIRTSNLENAKEYIRSGLACARSVSLTLIEGILLFSSARVSFLQGLYAKAHETLDTLQGLHPVSKLTRWGVHCLLAYLYWFQGKMEDAIHSLVSSMEICEANVYDNLLKEQAVPLMPLIVEVYARGEMHGYITKLLYLNDELKSALKGLEKHPDRRIAGNASAILEALPRKSPDGLTVSCLGTFKVSRAGLEISADEWRSKKAKMLFKLLLHYRSHGYTGKEVFMEHLWPEGDPKKTAKSFHVAMASLRKILEPEIARGAKSAYIISDRDSYHLDLGSGGQSDVELFLEFCQRARQEKIPEQAIALLLRAKDLYQGDFLEEDPYEAWCTEERDRLKGLYLSLLASIVEYHEWKKDYEQAILVCTDYLSHDPYAEDIYQRLMRYYAYQGNNAMVKKLFDRCSDTIVNGLGCPLSRDTLILFDELMA